LPNALGASMKGRDIIKRIESDGWRQIAQKGSHRQFRLLIKPSKVTANGHRSDDIQADCFTASGGRRD